MGQHPGAGNAGTAGAKGEGNRTVTHDITLIVVNYRTAVDVTALLASLAAFPPGCACEVIVVNATPEDAWRPGAGASPVTVRTVDAVANRGFGGNCNQALAEASGEFLMPMNADIRFRDDCLPRVVERLRTAPEVGVLVPRLVGADGTLQYSSRTFYTPLTILCRRTPLGRCFPTIGERHLMMERDHEVPFCVDWGSGAALVARRALLEDGWLFDERFFLYLEDVDLCARAWGRGLRVEYFPPATLIHAHARESAGPPWGWHARQHLRSLWRFWRKYGTLRPSGAPVGADGGASGDGATGGARP